MATLMSSTDMSKEVHQISKESSGLDTIGLGAVEQVQANIRSFETLTEAEISLLAGVAEMIRGKTAIGCTGCSYCVSHYPKQIPIPQYMKLYNEISRYPGDDGKIIPTYNQVALTAGKASDCIECHSCEKHCPQKLTIAEYMKAIGKKSKSIS